MMKRDSDSYGYRKDQQEQQTLACCGFLFLGVILLIIYASHAG